MPARPSLRKGDKIVNVQVATPCEVLSEAKAGYGNRGTPVTQHRKAVARALL